MSWEAAVGELPFFLTAFYTMSTQHKLYNTWESMRKRCCNPNDKEFKNYGGRGVKVCKRWDIADGKSTGFKNFVSDMGNRPNGFTLERINNNGNYTPSNCKWVSRKEQSRNMRNNVIYKGEYSIDASLRLTDGRNKTLVGVRLNMGWSKQRAFEEPCKKHGPKILYKGECQQVASLRLTEGRNKCFVRDRIRAGWSVKKAFTEPCKNTSYKNTS